MTLFTHSSGYQPTEFEMKNGFTQPIQEPTAWISKHGVAYPFDAKDEVNPINELQPPFTALPKREWVGLTKTQIKLLWEGVEAKAIHSGQSLNWVFYTYINEALKEKNS